MTKRLYKYIGPESIRRVFAASDRTTLKCNYPKDFNDPFELFLTIDFDEEPEILAFYSEVIGELPQLPTTCFSRSPSIIPMWAHYALGSTGFVIEIDEEKLVTYFPESGFGDVDYRKEPDESLAELLHRAYVICKPRYIYLLHKGVFSAAYYTKSEHWSYELERRMIIGESEVRNEDGLLLLDVPNDCVLSIISGPNAVVDVSTELRTRAASSGCNYFEMRIGRTSSDPYFIGSDNASYVFAGGALSNATSCVSCKEPVDEEAEYCSWCLIDDNHREDAAVRNTFRAYARAGILDSYLEDMQDIERKFLDE